MESNILAKVVGSAKWVGGQRKPHKKRYHLSKVPEEMTEIAMWIFRGRVLQEEEQPGQRSWA